MTGLILITLSNIVTLGLYALAKINSGSAFVTWTSAGQIAGTLGLIGLSWSYILAVRHAWLEKLFGGLDKAYKIHAIIGATSFIMVINHPLFFILSALPTDTIATYLLPSSSIPYTIGVLALYLLLFLLFMTLFVDLPYKLWKKTHEWMGVVIILAGVHAYMVPSALTSFIPFTVWVLSFAGVALLSFVYKRYFYYSLSPQYRYTVEKVVRDGETIVAYLTHATPGRDEPRFGPGQYAFFSLPAVPRDEHPFSILSQTPNRLVIACKTVGNFTLQLAQIRSGAEVIVRGGYGTFAQASLSARHMVWIAGGIGITPFATMAAALKPEQNATLVYTSRTSGPELITQAFRLHSVQRPNFRFLEHVTESAGHLTAKTLTRIAEFGSSTYFFLCGPQPMMETLTAELMHMGVKRKRIIYEDFNLK